LKRVLGGLKLASCGCAATNMCTLCKSHPEQGSVNQGSSDGSLTLPTALKVHTFQICSDSKRGDE
jgi:hypothetical protein